MCGDNSTSCFSPFPQDKKNLFKTGRVDCSPSPNASPYQKYLASGLENQPQQNGNGAMTLGVKIRNLKVDFKAGCTWHWVGQKTLIMNIYDFFYSTNSFSLKNLPSL